jgi:hypothetical protein
MRTLDCGNDKVGVMTSFIQSPRERGKDEARRGVAAPQKPRCQVRGPVAGPGRAGRRSVQGGRWLLFFFLSFDFPLLVWLVLVRQEDQGGAGEEVGFRPDLDVGRAG